MLLDIPIYCMTEIHIRCSLISVFQSVFENVLQKEIIYLHTLGGHASRLVKNLKLVPARREGVVADEVLQGRLLQPAGAEGGAAVGVLEDGVAARRALWREHCKCSQRDNISTGGTPRLSVPMIKHTEYGFYQAK